MLIYVPVKRRATLDPKKVQEIAESILQVGRSWCGKTANVSSWCPSVEGLHRLEACKQLGDSWRLAGRDRWHQVRRTSGRRRQHRP
jgi:sulfiredoxin